MPAWMSLAETIFPRRTLVLMRMCRNLFSHSLFFRMVFWSEEIAVLGISMEVSSPSSRRTRARYPSRWAPEDTCRITKNPSSRSASIKIFALDLQHGPAAEAYAFGGQIAQQKAERFVFALNLEHRHARVPSPSQKSISSIPSSRALYRLCRFVARYLPLQTRDLAGLVPSPNYRRSKRSPPQDLEQGQILTSVFLCAPQPASRAAEHSDAAFARGDGGDGRRVYGDDRTGAGRMVGRSSPRMSPRGYRDLSDLGNIRMIRSKSSKYPLPSGSSWRSRSLRRNKWFDFGLLRMSSKRKS